MELDTKKVKGLMESRGLTQAALAEEASVSRSWINTILGSNRSVREPTLRQIARALAVSVDEITINGDNACKSYKRFLTKRYGALDFRGCSLTNVWPLALRSMFVPLRVSGEGSGPETDSECGEARIKPFHDCYSEMNVRSIVPGSALIECISRYDRIYLKGEPGSGKTTSLKQIAVQYAEGIVSEKSGISRSLIPMFVPLAEYEKAIDSDSIRNPLEFVAAQARNDKCESVDTLLEGELRHGNVIVLLDGLDEVGVTDQVVTSIREFIDTFPCNKFVLTSRVIGSEEAPWKNDGFSVLRIEEWQDEDIQQFCAKWCAAIHEHESTKKCPECSTKADRLWQSIRSNSRVKAIATNPLMLTILAWLDHATGTIPRRRVDLYSRVVGVLLETWDSSKQVARPGDLLHGISMEAKEFQWLLGSIGLEMQRKDLRLIPRWWLADFIQDYLHRSLGFTLEESKEQSDRVIRYLGGRTGLLEERGQGLFGFSHLTFQEYFASRGIIDENAGGSGHDVSGRLRSYLFHPRWSEVVRLVCAQLPPAQCVSLIRVILDDPDPVGRFLRRGPLLAMRCLADGATVADRDLTSGLFDQVTGLGESKWVGITIDVLRALGGLQGTRYERDARKTTDEILGKSLGRVSPYNYVSLWRAAHGSLDRFMPEDARHWPGDEHMVKLPDLEVKIVCMGGGLESDSPQKWYEEVFAIIRNPSRDLTVRCDFISELSRSVLGNEMIRRFLESLVSGDADPGIRCVSALALRKAAIEFPHIRALILDRFRAPGVSADDRRCYGRALADSAPIDPDLRKLFLGLLDDDSESTEIKIAAAAGLALVTRSNDDARRILVELLESEQAPAQLREKCATSLEQAIGHDKRVDSQMISLIDDRNHEKLSRIINQALAEALAEGRIPWDAKLVSRIEDHLTSVHNPCPHALEALEDLLRTKELRGGLRLDSVLKEFLKKYNDFICISFIFGSTARLTQKGGSDIDLFVVGDVRLKDLALTLAEAEQVLGRPINPVIYTKKTFLEKLSERDPFLMQVLNGEKIILGGFDDELRAMVSKSIHHQPAGDGARTPSTFLDS
jgi:transcriptional regulator with XRE-family HTH domain/predicted nucleotidyltransferase